MSGHAILSTRYRSRFAAIVAALLGLYGGGALAQSVLQYHGSADRAGNYVILGLTPEIVSSTHLDRDFDGRVEGHVYAQPLLVHAAGRELLIVATENDAVDALDAHTGKPVWQKSLGRPVRSAMLPCGNVDPLGITGTPVIDEPGGALYLDAMVNTGGGPQHLVFGLAVANGDTLAGFPINVAHELATHGLSFTARDQNQRGALLILHNRLYIPYGGHFGDCGDYYGWLVTMDLRQPHHVAAWHTRAPGGGIWAPGGIVSDGHSLFAATGNTFDSSEWGDGEAVLRFSLELEPPASTSDHFAPADWRMLDRRDADLGGTTPLPIDVHDSEGVEHLMLALGKDGKAYLLNRDNLGGMGGALAVATVARDEIVTAPALYSKPRGAAFVVFRAGGINCPRAISNASLGALTFKLKPSPALYIAWCSSLDGAGVPMVTTTDGSANAIVWIAGAEGDNRLHAYRGDNGEPLLTNGPPQMHGLRHFAAIVPTQYHLFVPADDRIYAFAP